MNKVLAIRHVEIEHAGIFKEILSKKNYTIDYLDTLKGQLLKDSLENYSMLLILGGYMGVYEEMKYPFLKYEFKLVEQALKGSKPIIGICLGAQILAKVLGFSVYKGNNGKEIGFFDVKKVQNHEYFESFPEKFTVFQWHGDTFDLPESIRVFSSEKYQDQGFAVNNAIGLQFHIEITLTMIKEWLKLYAQEAEKESVNSPEVIFEAKAQLTKLKVYAQELIGKMIADEV